MPTVQKSCLTADWYFRSFPSEPTFLAWLEAAAVVVEVVVVAALLAAAAAAVQASVVAAGSEAATAAVAAATEVEATLPELAIVAVVEVDAVAVATLHTELRSCR